MARTRRKKDKGRTKSNRALTLNLFLIMNPENLFLDYWNNWLTLERFAEYYGLTLKEAENLLKQAKAEFNAKRSNHL